MKTRMMKMAVLIQGRAVQLVAMLGMLAALLVPMSGVAHASTLPSITGIRSTIHGTSNIVGYLASDSGITTTYVGSFWVCPRELRWGAQGDDVRTLQQLLTSQGYMAPGQVDGIFGPITYNAVVYFQQLNGLQVDGIVGPQTWSALGGCHYDYYEY